MQVWELQEALKNVNPFAEVMISHGAITGVASHLGSLAYSVEQGDSRPVMDTTYRILLEPSAVKPQVTPIFGTHHLVDEV